jgi:hypothetical protein
MDAAYQIQAVPTAWMWVGDGPGGSSSGAARPGWQNEAGETFIVTEEGVQIVNE